MADLPSWYVEALYFHCPSCRAKLKYHELEEDRDKRYIPTGKKLCPRCREVINQKVYKEPILVTPCDHTGCDKVRHKDVWHTSGKSKLPTLWRVEVTRPETCGAHTKSPEEAQRLKEERARRKAEKKARRLL